MDTAEYLGGVLREALWNAHGVHYLLGKAGTELLGNNQFADKTLRGDIGAEDAVLRIFRRANIPITVVSEERGITVIGTNAQHLGVLDGLDGSTVYARNRNVGRYGTMFAIFSGLNPKYEDYVCAGIVEHGTGVLVSAIRGQGATLERKVLPLHADKRTLPHLLTTSAERKSIHASDRKTLAPLALIYCNLGWQSLRDFAFAHLRDLNLVSLYSTAAHFTDIATGCADALIECTRKGNLELAVGYALTREAGGVMQTAAGTDLGPEFFLSFAQDQQIPIIAAGTREVAAALRERFSELTL
ncbi:MAG TPA: inositol monophosphatase family protein [Candidatus Nanoarchaeia archaeon]|nr:inositol monophosphatase family protein [Candidatus Nanoarchaeia archaeon]